MGASTLRFNFSRSDTFHHRQAVMEGMRSEIKTMLQGIERYNPENIKTLEHYVDLQAREKGYDLEANLLEMCQFKVFWEQIHSKSDLIKSVTGFEDSIRRFVCHVISIAYQTIEEKVVGELLGLVQENAVQFW